MSKLWLKRESLERDHERELNTLDRDIDTLYDRRRIEGMTRSEVLNEWDRRRGNVRERQLGELQNVEIDVAYEQKMMSEHSAWRPPRPLVSILAVLFLIFGISIYAVFLPHHAYSGTKHVVIASGMGSRMIGAFLKREGVIGSKWAFVTYVSLRGEASDLKPGAYEFPDTAAIPAIARDLVAGESRERMITIPEGWSNADIAEYFELQGVAMRDEAMNFMKSPPDDIVSLLEPLGAARKSSGTEGYLFPDTYRIFHDAGLADITGKMLKNFDAKVTQDLRDAIESQNKSIFEIVTMASLIEKEVSGEEDRALVSGILWKRISLSMPLQVDATIVYINNQEARIMNQGNGKITTVDIRKDSPYNTYRYRGLPRGPIANPGLSAIRAAVFPRFSPYLYYLSAPDGRTVFSRTLEEHNAAKAKYLK